MAHKLDSNAKTGKLAMFSVKETPWHREGIILENAPSFEDAFQLAGNGFIVNEQPIFLYDKVLGYVQMEDYKAITRDDNGSVMQVAGKNYSTLQYREAFEPLEPLVDKGVITLETGGSLREGKQAWMMGKLNFSDPVVNEVFANELIPYMMITSGHDGLHGPEIGLTEVRVVCANTLAIARMGNSLVKLRHKGDVRSKLIYESEKLFSGIIERYQGIALQYKAMKERILTVEEFTKGLLDKIAPLPAVTKPEDVESRGYVSASIKRDAFTYKWDNGAGHKGDHSAWEAYNGVVEVIDHNEDIFRINKGGSRVNSLLGGRLEAKKDEALSLIMAML